ncbi:hypothetical protein Clacol_000535 [Clathrus columnatus]|uniref:Peptide hydrolase n=1 Tax=Clathrus columnatus TaxID=1419009 RepID=A0AAV4ZWR2_9AGAM|nr:hypothetical protein Clacol_000535 [Clathrus columnatus]
MITTRPHPFNSRANDAVRSYILSRLNEIDSGTRTALIVDNDIYSNVTWQEGRAGRYFEGNNILVKIEGRNPELKAVLFSAHYDSVSTAYGATDDGMGVVTLLQLITYFSKNTPSRTVVFNINNGEEDGLYGSHAFLSHPWSKEIGFFLNLEGAGAGGVPIVFRTSSYEVTQALKTTSHPHGSVFSSDTFALGLIRSRTDYSVYTAAGMSGLDFAFYQRRSYYHTMRDTISNLNGPGSLWLFMDSSLSIGRSLSQIDSPETGRGLPLHFDLNLLSPPFSEEAPLKVLFYQAVNLTEQSSEVQLTGVEGYIQKVVSQIPSTWQHPISCEADALSRLTRCKWNSTTAITKDMVSLDTEVIRSGEATLTVKGQNTRFCRILFDRPVLAFHVNGSAGEVRHGYSFPSNGTTELQLWSRERSKPFVVDVSWPQNETLQGRASCGWSDSQDWEDHIPAFKEILDFLPSWSLVSKRDHGLVEASLEFSL